MFSYTGLDIRAVDLPEPTFPFRRFEAFRGSLMFHIVAVWTYESKVRAESYRQAHKGLVEHNAWIRQNPTVVMGDFNQSAKFKSDSWPKLMEITEPLGLVSAYHHYFQEEPGKEMRPTHFHQGKETAPFHLDYVFLPKAWADRITRVEVGSYADWHDLSDHAPLIVDLDLPATA